MMMDDYKSSDNFNGVEGSKLMSPHHFHPTNGVRPSDVIGIAVVGVIFAGGVAAVAWQNAAIAPRTI